MAPRNEKFDGTGISPEHVGDVVAASLDSLQLAVSDAGEAGGGAAANEFRVSLQVQDSNGKNFKAVTRLELFMFDANTEPEVVAAHTITAITGTVVTADAKANLVIDTDANGLAVVDILDVSTVLAADTWLRAEPIDRTGKPTWHKMTYA